MLLMFIFVLDYRKKSGTHLSSDVIYNLMIQRPNYYSFFSEIDTDEVQIFKLK